jgi:predicted porin
MQKKLIALAIASAISAPVLADNANFTFYGTADVSYDMVTTGDGTTKVNGSVPVAGVTKRVVSSNVSKFGFKGSEDLGDGLAAVWQIEQQINIDDSSNKTTVAACDPTSTSTTACPATTVSANNGLFATRNTFAGVKSETMGTVLLGRHDTPYKIATRKLDVFADNIADNRSLIGKTSSQGFELRPTDVLAYISPAFAGVTAAVATVNLSEGNTTSGPAASQYQQKNGAFSLAVMYDVAPFYGSVAVESHTLNTLNAANEPGKSESAKRVGFGFKPEGFELNVVFESTSDNLGTGTNAGVNTYGHSAFYVGGKVHTGANSAVKVAFTKAGEYGTGNLKITDSGASQVSVGYDLGLSKRTKLYALYTKISNGKGINYAFSQNSGAASTSSGFGTSPSALSFGLKHSF